MFLNFHGCRASDVLKMFLRPEDIDGVEVMLLSWYHDVNCVRLTFTTFVLVHTGVFIWLTMFLFPLKLQIYSICWKFVYKKILEGWFEAELVLNMFLFLREFEAQCSYKIVLIKKKEFICNVNILTKKCYEMLT